MSNSWKHFEINQKYVDACNEMSSYASTENREEYWKKCAEFLKQIKNFPYEALTVKQRNWVFNIKADLKGEGMV